MTDWKTIPDFPAYAVDLGRKMRPVHQLVAELFLGPRPEGLVIDTVLKI
jgi:hypothetical protein